MPTGTRCSRLIRAKIEGSAALRLPAQRGIYINYLQSRNLLKGSIHGYNDDSCPGRYPPSATVIPARIPEKFKNEPSIDWSNPENTRRMRTAIEKVRHELGREYDLVIGGRRVKTEEKTESLNPAKPSEVVGVFSTAGAAEVEPAMQAALKAFETWKYASVEERTNLLFRVSHLLRERKFELMAWMIFEVGKNWAEADGDIAEPSISVTSTRWKRSVSTRLSRRCSCLASATGCATFRWASAR